MSHGSGQHRFVVWATLLSVVIAPGCSRRFWREQAESDTYAAVAEKQSDERWLAPRLNITPDERSRFYDPNDPDCPPLPPDDPAAHKFMHCANGLKGYKSWHKFGSSVTVENPQWLEAFGVTPTAEGGMNPVSAHSSVELNEITLPEAIELSYIHSRDYQTQIESLFLDALELTFQRFQFGVRYLGVNGQEPGLGATYSDTPGTEAWGIGKNFGISQALPAGGQWAVELANNTIHLFGTGGPARSSSSSLAFSLVQPLLFGAGRKVAMENLTQAERNVLYTTRDLARFRKELFTDTTNTFLNILLQRQSIINQVGNIARLREQIEQAQFRDRVQRPFQVPGDLLQVPEGFMIPDELSDRLSYDDQDGFLFWRGQSISDEEAAAVLAVSDDEDYQQAAKEVIELVRAGAQTNSLNVLQLLNRLSSNQNQLRNAERQLQDLQDTFKIQLGLPPDINLDINTSLLRPFELISSDLRDSEARITETLSIVDRPLNQDAKFENVVQFIDELELLVENVEETGFEALKDDFGPVEALLKDEDAEAAAQDGRIFLSATERDRVESDLARDRRLYNIARSEFAKATRDLKSLKTIVEGMSAEDAFKKLDQNMDGTIEIEELKEVFTTRLRRRLDVNEDGKASTRELVNLVESIGREIREDMRQATQSIQVVQAGLRAELIAVNRFTLNGEGETPSIDEVVRIGLESRLDLMNERAEVMDARRQLEIAANALEATLNLRVDGRVGTRAGNQRPFDFSSDETQLDVGLELTTPLDQIQERNTYATALVAYQRARRTYMAFEDQVKVDIRQSWRQLRVSEQQLEIDRQQIRQAALQYDSAAQNAARGGQQNAFNLLNSLDSLLGAQNSLIRDWITYERNRLNIYRDMGIMEIGPNGVWNDEFYATGQNPPPEPGLNEDSSQPAPLLESEKFSDEEAPPTAPKPLEIPDPPANPEASRGIGAVDRVGYSRRSGGHGVRRSVATGQSNGNFSLGGLRRLQSVRN